MKFAIKLRNETLSRKNIIEKTNEYLVELTLNKNLRNPDKTIITNKEKVEILPNKFWFQISSSGIYYFFGILMMPLMLFLDKTSTLLQRITMSILLSAMFGGMGLFFFWVCSLIPMILEKSWAINYIINLLIQSSLIFLMFKFNKQNNY